MLQLTNIALLLARSGCYWDKQKQTNRELHKLGKHCWKQNHIPHNYPLILLHRMRHLNKVKQTIDCFKPTGLLFDYVALLLDWLTASDCLGLGCQVTAGPPHVEREGCPSALQIFIFNILRFWKWKKVWLHVVKI